MSQKTLNLCLERYNFVKFGETTKSSHTVLCINNAYSVNSDKYRLTPTAIASKHGDGYVFTLNYDFDRPLFTIVQKSYSLDGTSGNIVFEGIDPISKGGSKYLRKVTVSPVKLSDGSYLLEVTNDEYLRIGTTGAALGDEELESLNEKIVTMGGIEKSVETVGGKQVLRLDAGGPSGAKEIVYFDIDPSDPPSGIYEDIGEALSSNKLPAIKIDGAVYLYTATGTDKYVFVGGFTKEAVGYTEIEVSDDDIVASKSVDDKVFNMYILPQDDPASPGETPSDEDQWVCDADKHVITKDELVAAHTDCRYFILNNAVEPDSNSRKYFASVTVISNSYIRLRFYMMQYDAQGVAEFHQKTVVDDSEGRLYILSSYSATLAGTTQAVLVSEPQSFDSTQKAQGRDNIGAASASDVAALQSQVSSLSDVSAYSVKGEATVAQLNAGPSGIQAGWAYQLTDSGTLTDGSLAVVAGDTVAWDGTKWFPLVRSDYYATKTYAQNVAHSIAPEYNSTTGAVAGHLYMHDGVLYRCKENTSGDWDSSKFELDNAASKFFQDEMKKDMYGAEYTGSISTPYASLNISASLKKGTLVNASISSENESLATELYAFYTDNDYDFIGMVGSAGKSFVLSKDYIKFRFYNPGTSVNLSATVKALSVNERFEKDETEIQANKNNIDSLNSFSFEGELITEEKTAPEQRFIDVYHDFKKGYKLIAKVVSDTSISVSVYAYTDASNFDDLGTANTSDKEFILAKKYVRIRFYYYGSTNVDYSAQIKIVSVGERFADDETKINGLTSRVNAIEGSSPVSSSDYYGDTFTKTGTGRAIDFEHAFKKGAKLDVWVSAEASGDVVGFIGFLDSTNYEVILNATTSKTTVILTNDYVKVRFYNNTHNVAYTGNIVVHSVPVRVSQCELNTYSTPLKMLVIGDSYSASVNHYIKYMLPKLPLGSELKTTAVVGAKLKDREQNRTLYPYTSRPVSGAPGNQNVFASQIEKLKRLMAGVDLDEGEEQWYATEADYPNVIIVAGGQNDKFDADESHYFEQFVVKYENVYYKNYENNVVEGSCYAKTDIETIDRTTFAGSYRYLCETLRKMFPKAHLFITTVANLSYWTDGYTGNVNPFESRMKEAIQQRWCSHACGATLIDWQDSQISCLTTYPGGSGTSEDPFLVKGNGEPYSDSNDGMHPNDQGAKKLGRYTARVIMSAMFDE